MKAPFSCVYSSNFPELLISLNCSLAISTYQAGKLIFISPNGGNQLIQLPRNFRKAMGIAVDNRRIAVATEQEICVLADAPSLAYNYPPKPKIYDALYIPRATYYTGMVDIHDMDWDKNGRLWAVNTRFSCLSIIDDHYSFIPKWTPPFIKQFVPHDLCHLNGMCMENNMPKYVTMFAKSTTPKGWRSNIQHTGLLMDVTTNEVVASNLPMPHSPRLYNGELYTLLSATGEIVRIDRDTGKYQVIAQLNGFVRGMEKYGDYLFVGLSKIRKNASIFRDLPISKKAIHCGVQVIHLPTGVSVAHLHYEQSVEELYDIKIIPDKLRPGILNHQTLTHRFALNTPEYDFWSENKPEIG